MSIRLFTAVLVVAAQAYSQTSRGTVTGTVLDSSGAAIPATRVTLTGAATGVRLATVSKDTAVYRFDAVDLGVYELKVTHAGFQTYISTGITVEANRVATVDPRLALGAAETRIEVSATAGEILIQDGPLRGGNFQPRQIRELPLLSLNPLSLARTLPD